MPFQNMHQPGPRASHTALARCAAKQRLFRRNQVKISLSIKIHLAS
jgi:hypothetical protein